MAALPLTSRWKHLSLQRDDQMCTRVTSATFTSFERLLSSAQHLGILRLGACHSVDIPPLRGGSRMVSHVTKSWVVLISRVTIGADLSPPGINAPGIIPQLHQGSLLNQLHFIWNGVSLTFQLESQELCEMFPRLRRELGVANKWFQSLAAPGLCSSGPEVRSNRRSSPTFIKNYCHLLSSFHLNQND